MFSGQSLSHEALSAIRQLDLIVREGIAKTSSERERYVLIEREKSADLWHSRSGI